MHFTLVFDSDEAHDRSYGLVFIPCPVWVQGQTEVVTLHGNPHYERGDLHPLLRHIGRGLRNSPRRVVCVVHPSGIGTQQHLDTLMADLADASFEVTLVEMGTPAA